MGESIVVVGAALSADVDAPTERVYSAPGARCGQSARRPGVDGLLFDGDAGSRLIRADYTEERLLTSRGLRPSGFSRDGHQGLRVRATW